MVPRSTRPDEERGLTIGAADLQLLLGRDSTDVEEGDVVVPLGQLNGRTIVGLTVAVGTGEVHLTDERAIGVVWDSTITGGTLPAKLQASIDDYATGEVLTFSVDRSAIDDVELKTGFGGAVKEAELSGQAIVRFTPMRVLGGVGRFVKPARGVVASGLRSWVG
jgi:hypothetical protein